MPDSVPDRVPTSVLAVDLGKTGCRARLWIGEHTTEAEGLGAPGLAAPNGVALAFGAILQAAAPLLRAAGLTRVDAVGVGAAGALADRAAAMVLTERLCAALPAGRVVVASDAITSHVGALGGGPGVTLAIGTGAVAIAVGPSGEMTRSDGWGPWLGDEGGGAWLGLHGLRAALRAHDGRGPPTLLAAAAEARFGSLATLAAQMESSPSPPRLAASFAADVAKAAEAGDAVAAGLLDQACAALAGTVRSVLPQQSGAAGAVHADGSPPRHEAARDDGSRGVPLAVIGGLAQLETGLVRPLLEALGPTVSPVAPLGSSLDGARRLALDTGTVHEPSLCRAAAATANGLDLLATEGRRPGLDDLDLRSPGDIVRLVLAAEREAQDALARAADPLAAAADAIAARMTAGGRLFTLGAGTPGRLAVLDAAELAPTYSAPPGLVIALLAGGPAAMLEAAEGAEDDRHAAAAALDAHGLGPGDSVVGIAASGRTPYVVAGLAHARARGALTVAIVNNPGSPAAAAAALAVEILTGPEIVAGSTRMTAGTTVQKIALNALSTAAMIALGKTYGALDGRRAGHQRRSSAGGRSGSCGRSPEPARTWRSAALAAGGGSIG